MPTRTVSKAIDGFAQGLDFADALARGSRAVSQVTFDRRLANRASKLGYVTPVESST